MDSETLNSQTNLPLSNSSATNKELSLIEFQDEIQSRIHEMAARTGKSEKQIKMEIAELLRKKTDILKAGANKAIPL